MTRSQLFGAYVHIPFCHHKCDYCAFATWVDKHELIDNYLSALIQDIERTQEHLSSFDTVFIGGGTPSLVPAKALMKVLGALQLSNAAEVTVECNPDDVTQELMDTFVAGGVNRISLGVQSMVVHVLAKLGRTHNPDNVQRAVKHARAAGIESINLDVIYGTVNESLEDWQHTLDSIVALQPDHVSAYGLTVEAGTALATRPDEYPDDDVQADKYLLANSVLEAGGLINYEISNWARPGHECRHNQMYWGQGNYVGFGCAAHSHRDGRRWWNVRTPERYIDCVMRGVSTETAGEDLDDATREREGLELSLRTREGVPESALQVEDLGDLVERRGDRVVLTIRGRLLANEVSLRLRNR
jgi:putative oxygen-independent coproporphyrinogen III oxidase